MGSCNVELRRVEWCDGWRGGWGCFGADRRGGYVGGVGEGDGEGFDGGAVWRIEDREGVEGADKVAPGEVGEDEGGS